MKHKLRKAFSALLGRSVSFCRTSQRTEEVLLVFLPITDPDFITKIWQPNHWHWQEIAACSFWPFFFNKYLIDILYFMWTFNMEIRAGEIHRLKIKHRIVKSLQHREGSIGWYYLLQLDNCHPFSSWGIQLLVAALQEYIQVPFKSGKGFYRHWGSDIHHSQDK